MPRRPFILTLLALCYFFSPLVIIVQASLINRIPLLGSSNIFTRIYYADWIVLLMYPVGALAIYSVKKWGWYLFMICSAYLIIYNIVVYYVNPRYHLYVIVLYNVALTSIAGIFFRKHIIAPYFNPRLRWWETEPRYKVEIHAEMILGEEHRSGEVLDISTTGSFIAVNRQIPLGKIYQINIRCLRHYVEVIGKIMRKSSSRELYKGYGVMFIHLTNLEIEGVRAIIEDLKSFGLRNDSREHWAERMPYRGTETGISDKMIESRNLGKTGSRYVLTHNIVLTDGNKIKKGTIIDISRHGCFMETDQDIPEGARYRVSMSCLKNEAEVYGRIVRKSEAGGVYGYGIKFDNMDRRSKQKIKGIIKTLKNLGARERLKDAHRVPEEVIDECAANSPYRVVLFFTRLFKPAA